MSDPSDRPLGDTAGDQSPGVAAARVALICDYSLAYMGGAQSVFVDEAELFASVCDVALVVAPAMSERQRAGAARVPDVGIRSFGTIPGVGLPIIPNTRRLRAQLRQLFTHERITTVHLHSEFGLAAAATAVANELGISVIHTVHTFFWAGPDLGRLDGAAARLVNGTMRALRGAAVRRTAAAPRRLDSALRSVTLDTALRADRVISPSAHQAAALQLAGVDDVAVIPNPIRLHGTPGNPLRSIDGPLRIVWVARMAPEKRILEFVQAVVDAGRELAPGSIDVTVVGEGPLRDQAEAIARQATIEHGATVRFTGRVDRDEVERLMTEAHLVALTSLGFDNQPVVVVEAFNAARSVFYVDAQLQEGLAEAGILADSPDVDGMARTLVNLARHPEIVVERSQLTVAASRQFLPDVHVRAVQAVWSAAAQTGGDHS